MPLNSDAIWSSVHGSIRSSAAPGWLELEAVGVSVALGVPVVCGVSMSMESSCAGVGVFGVLTPKLARAALRLGGIVVILVGDDFTRIREASVMNSAPNAACYRVAVRWKAAAFG
jgi:hypothetical protein